MDEQLTPKVDVVEHKLSPRAAEYALEKTLLTERRLRFEAERLLLLARRKNAKLDPKKALRNQRRLERASKVAFEARERRRQVEAAIAAHSQADSMLSLVGRALEIGRVKENESGAVV